MKTENSILIFTVSISLKHLLFIATARLRLKTAYVSVRARQGRLGLKIFRYSKLGKGAFPGQGSGAYSPSKKMFLKHSKALQSALHNLFMRKIIFSNHHTTDINNVSNVKSC